MSKRSTFKIHQRVKEGVNGKRRVQLHVMRTQAQKISDLVAAGLKSLIAEEVANELSRRGYRDREDGMPFVAVSQESGTETDSEAPGPMEETTCPKCGAGVLSGAHCYCGYDR
jgi:hypothetical protein